MGSTRDAFRAGRYPALRPMAESRIADATMTTAAADIACGTTAAARAAAADPCRTAIDVKPADVSRTAGSQGGNAQQSHTEPYQQRHAFIFSHGAPAVTAGEPPP